MAGEKRNNVGALGMGIKVGLAAIAMLSVLGLDTAPARAQCSAGNQVGSCSPGVGFAGCCNGSRVTWCEGTAQCEINCADNVNAPTNSCCTASSSPGCCDNTIMQCVCAIDDFCCGAYDFIFGEGYWDDYCVDLARFDCGGCGTCAGPATQCGWQASEGYYDCSPTATTDPSGVNPRVCGGGCTPQCSGRQCGPDGCGGVCGQCLSTQSCNTGTGQCVASCTPQCSGRQCGPDGCGGQCGSCGAGQTCNTGTGQCAASCTPQCSGRQCGSDGCGGTCGTCGAGQTCNGATGQCTASCTPNCTGKVCGADGCGGVCGQCLSSQECNAQGQCVAPCVPSCNGKQCGDDGCGGSCGQCLSGQTCNTATGQCASSCAPNCNGKQCGDDSCGGSCGTCGAGEACDAGGQCASSCSCDGKQCGDDGCGRVCGYCGPNTVCNNETQQCDAAPVTTPDPEPSDTISTPQNCPKGQIWSNYAGACVIDPNGNGATSSKSSGCGGGAMPSILVGLGVGMLGLLRRRR